MENEYVRCRRAYYQALTAASVYRAWGKLDQERKCTDLAVQILARSPEEFYREIISQHEQAKAIPRRIEAIRRNPKNSR